MYKSSSGAAGRIGAGAILIASFSALLGCVATLDPPRAALTAATDAIASAERTDARQYAGAELDEAKHKLLQAEGAVEAENMLDAERLAMQARIAADLATARTEAAKASEINRQLYRDADALHEEMERTRSQP